MLPWTHIIYPEQSAAPLFLVSPLSHVISGVGVLVGLLVGDNMGASEGGGVTTGLAVGVIVCRGTREHGVLGLSCLK